jgi:excisionase family DNA binding protein
VVRRRGDVFGAPAAFDLVPNTSRRSLQMGNGGDTVMQTMSVHADVMAGSEPLELLTPDELAGLLKVKVSWIYDQVEAGRLPVLRLNRRLRFRRGDVYAFLEESLTV